MAKEISREFKPHEGIVVVTIEDEFGVQVPHSIRALIVDKCPTCGNQNVVSGDIVDTEASVAALIAATDAITAKKIDAFQAAGMDVSAQRTAFANTTRSN